MPLSRHIRTTLCYLLSFAAMAAVAAPPLTLADVNGKSYQPLVMTGKQTTVFFFIAHDCPISNTYAPEMNRICAEYGPKNVAFYIVYTDTDTTTTAEREHAKAFGYRCTALRDPNHLLARQLGATITPEVAVVAPDGKRVYRGRIDNTYAQVGVRRTQTTEHDLRDALDAVLQKRPVPHPTTSAVGCFIPPVKLPVK